MSKTLLLLRHGKSDWSGNLNDFDRPLKKRGKLAAQRMGEFMRLQGIEPDYIVSSPAERAKTSALKLTKAMGKTAAHVRYEMKLYDAKIKDFLAVLANCPEDKQRILLISHNPGLEELIKFLHDGPVPLPNDGKLLPTTTLAILDLPDDLQRLIKASGQLQSLTRPSQIPDYFTYQIATGVEHRIRPAYYYSQSGALPFRIENGEMQLLLITSSANRHWIIPKGIIEPGMTAYESAANEAREEAGVKGIISHQVLGCYHYAKWNASCTVQVFPMQVTEFVDDSDWEETHRQRQWVTYKQALEMIKIPKLVTIIELLHDKFQQSLNG